MELTKKQFSFGLAVTCLLLVVSVLVVFSLKQSNDADDESPKGYGSLYETINNTESLKTCREKARRLQKRMRFNAELGKDLIAVRARKTGGLLVNSLWLTGNKPQDARVLAHARLFACEDRIPVLVFRLRPELGYDESERIQNWNYYKPKSRVRSWSEYDSLLEYYLEVLQDVPSIVVLEPDLLMMLKDPPRNNVDELSTKNHRYEELFLQRAFTIITKLKNSWVYMDVGNSQFLREPISNLNSVAATLNRLPGLRGFVINTMHFMNDVSNEYWARKIFCRTGLHYVIDTGRNGGEFSEQNFNVINGCPFDPPQIKQGKQPGWSWGSRNNIVVKETIYLRKNPNADQSLPLSIMLSKQEGMNRMRERAKDLKECVGKVSTNVAQDASIWVKNPGEADGRLYEFGVYEPCLIGHQVSCTGGCQMISPIEKKYKSPECECNRPDGPDLTDDYDTYDEY